MPNASDYGLHPTNTPRGNLQALRRAAAATRPGGALTIAGYSDQVIRVDTSGGRSQAIVLDRTMTVRLDARLQATHGDRRRDPPFLFNVTGRGVVFEGRGELAGSGSVDDLNVGRELEFPGLVFVTGDEFQWQGPTIRTPPKLGIFLHGCHGGRISGRWRGGPMLYTAGRTAYFGIRATGGGWHHITDNDFGRDESGGRLVTAVFSGGDSGGAIGCTLRNNRADVHEKLAYLWGDGHAIADCAIVNANATDVIRLNGSRNCVHRVFANRVAGGVSIYDGAGNEVSDCAFSGVEQAGIYVAANAGYRSGFDATRILRNHIVADPSSARIQDGILLNLSGSDSRFIRIEDNELRGFGLLPNQAQIRVEMPPPYVMRDVSIWRNRITGGRQAAIRLRGDVRATITDNIMRDLAGLEVARTP